MSVGAEVYVLDSFAMLAYLEAEVGMERIKQVLKTAEQSVNCVYLPLINLGEVVYITERERGLPEAHAVLATVEQLPIEVLPVTRAAVLAAAHIKANHTLSYADAFVVAAAQDLRARVLTGDPEFGAVAELITIEWL